MPTLNVRLTDKEYTRLTKLAELESRSLNSAILTAVKFMLHTQYPETARQQELLLEEGLFDQPRRKRNAG